MVIWLLETDAEDIEWKNEVYFGTISCYPCTLGEGSLVIILEHKRRPAAIKMKENQRKLYVSLVGPYAAKMLPHKNP